MQVMIFEELDEFKKDFKRLLKKYKTLEEDFEIIKKVLEAAPEERSPVSYRISGLGIQSNIIIIKMKRIACMAMKGKGSNTGLRLIYSYEKNEERIIMIEFYFKGDKESEDRDRINKYFR